MNDVEQQGGDQKKKPSIIITILIWLAILVFLAGATVYTVDRINTGGNLPNGPVDTGIEDPLGR